MGKYDNYYASLDQQQAARATELAGKESGEGRTELDPIRRFGYKKLIKKDAIGTKQYFMALLMGYKPEHGPFSLFRTRGTHFNIPNPENPTQDLIRDCSEDGDAPSGISCPFCELVANVLKLSNDKETRANIWRMKSQLKATANAIPLSAHKQEVDREAFPYSPHLLEISEQMLATATEIMELQGGSSVVLNPKATLPFFIEAERTGHQPQNVKYNCGFFAKATPLADSDEDIDALFDSAYDLTKVMKYPSVEDVAKYRVEAAAAYEVWKKRLTGAPATATVASPFAAEVEEELVAVKKVVVKAPKKVAKVEEPSFN